MKKPFDLALWVFYLACVATVVLAIARRDHATAWAAIAAGLAMTTLIVVDDK